MYIVCVCVLTGFGVGGSVAMVLPRLWLRAERYFFIDNLLVQIHLIIEMILVDRLCAKEV